jgi:hypothetical protein
MVATKSVNFINHRIKIDSKAKPNLEFSVLIKAEAHVFFILTIFFLIACYSHFARLYIEVYQNVNCNKGPV